MPVFPPSTDSYRYSTAFDKSTWAAHTYNPLTTSVIEMDEVGSPRCLCDILGHGSHEKSNSSPWGSKASDPNRFSKLLPTVALQKFTS